MSRQRRPGPTSRVRVTEVKGATQSRHEDRVVTEEPLEIRVEPPGEPTRRITVTMRTPGQDFELAAGWMFHEGLVGSLDDIATVAYCTDVDLTPEQEFNVVTVRLTTPLRRPAPDRYAGPTAGSSACGVCGAESIEAALHVHPAQHDAGTTVPLELVRDLPDRMRDAQPLFDRTGGIHATGVFAADGALRLAREDVGRHNAFDKATGAQLLAGDPLDGIVCVSGRIGFELVQKAVASRRTALVAVGAPTSLAVDLAERAGLLLVGFTRGERAVVYAGADRLG